MTAANRRAEGSGQGLPPSRSAWISSMPGMPARSEPARSASPERSRSMPVTGWPAAANRRRWRPPPHAMSRTAPPAVTSGAKRRTQGEGSRVVCIPLLPRPLSSWSTEFVHNPDKGFSGCGFELIAELKVELGLERVDLVGGDGRDGVNEGVDDGSMLGQIDGREHLKLADVGHVPGLEQGFILQR